MKQRLRTFFALAIALAAAACGSGGSDGNGGGSGSGASAQSSSGAGGSTGTQPPARDLYRPAIKNIVVEIDYAPGAEPYTGSVLGFGELWDVFRTNAARLFQGGGKTIEIPTTLAQMEKLDDVSGADFTPEQILDIAARHRDKLSMGDTATFYIVWLDGYYRENGMVLDNVLGVSLGSTGVIAMFKPVIAGTSSGTPGIETERYVEQATLVHEFGHAAGLVHNGLDMVSPHEDTAHGHHCSNTDCVMYWTVEGPSGAIDYVSKALFGNKNILWGSECLADTDKALASP
ncbi:MAG: hypothetical protein QM820_65100 [Minicystis sp.]